MSQCDALPSLHINPFAICMARAEPPPLLKHAEMVQRMAASAASLHSRCSLLPFGGRPQAAFIRPRRYACAHVGISSRNDAVRPAWSGTLTGGGGKRNFLVTMALPDAVCSACSKPGHANTGGDHGGAEPAVAGKVQSLVDRAFAEVGPVVAFCSTGGFFEGSGLDEMHEDRCQLSTDWDGIGTRFSRRTR